jgi:SSS family solute:Na+ symporter
VLLPYFLRTGITTIPEFLEVRYNHQARLLMTVSMIFILIAVSLIGVIYAGALTFKQLMVEYNIDLSLTGACWALGIMAAIYVAIGGLKACAWADLIQGSALIIGGGIIAYFAFKVLGATDVAQLVTSNGTPADVAQDASVMTKFNSLNNEAMSMGHNVKMPWPILLLGIWIPNFYYWGLNQYITQRILGSASLAEGQKGLVFAGALKLIIPFVIVIPGIIAFNLYAPNMKANASQGSAEVFAKYVKVNPATKALTLQMNPESSIVDGWKGDSILLAVYDEKDIAKSVKNKERDNPMIVAINKAAFQKAQNSVTTPLKFKSDEEETFATVWPALSLEIKEYNKTITDPKAVKEKLLAYKYDTALGLLITKLIPQNKGILGFVLAALLGAIISSLAAILNAASTLLTMDVYHRYANKAATQFRLVSMGRIFIGVFVVLGCLLAPLLENYNSIFEYIQKVQGFVSAGILAVFIYGLINRTSSKWLGVLGLILNPIFYYILTTDWFKKTVWPEKAWGECHFLYSMSFSLLAVLAVMIVCGLVWKQKEKVVFESNTTMDLTTSKGALMWGLVVCVATVALYVIFW